MHQADSSTFAAAACELEPQPVGGLGFAKLPAINFAHSHVSDLHAQFLAAKPWPHLVIDNFIEPILALHAEEHFKTMPSARSFLAGLLGARAYCGSLENVDSSIDAIFKILHSEQFTSLLEAITGIGRLEPDRDLIGAGLHQGARGSILRIHADHNSHPAKFGRFRRVNIILYLNSDWSASWNGALELWDRKAQRCEKSIEPIFNRCVIMGVDDTAYHGYGRLNLPRNRTRKSLATYYYSGKPAAGQASEAHPTTFPQLYGRSSIDGLSDRFRRSAITRLEKLFRIPH